MKHCILALVVFAAPALAQGFDAMAMADADHDGRVTREEYAAFRETGWGFFSQGADAVTVAELPEMAKGAFRGIAPDAKGQVTHEAYTAAAPSLFKAADANKDGALDAAELATAM